MPLETGTDATGKYRAEVSRKDLKHPLWSSDAEDGIIAPAALPLGELEQVLAGLLG